MLNVEVSKLKVKMRATTLELLYKKRPNVSFIVLSFLSFWYHGHWWNGCPSARHFAKFGHPITLNDPKKSQVAL